ncbi:MAG: methyltransferase type 12 [Rhodospirillaceae bacterium]|nr:methyltransferase type 12 [Rhodospirillaceae bacterium]
MTGQSKHALTVETTHDEHALQSYVSALRMFTLRDVGGGLRNIYENRVKPDFVKHEKREPSTEHEVRHAMMKDPYCATWSSMMRACQEMIWASVIPSIERSQPELNRKATPKQSKNLLGSLKLNDNIKIPKYLSACDIHLMPGNYHTERAKADISQGALYDRGVYVYSGGYGGPNQDAIGRSLTEYLKMKFPNFNPKKVLDVGCTVGQNTLPLKETFRDADVHAIDVSAPMLRYAHGRSESLGYGLHLSQMDAESMQYEDSSFDLVVSIIFLHETSRSAMKNILKECKRVLKSGGLMIHMELPRTHDMDPFDAFYIDWDSYYNNEPFYQAFTSTDMRKAIIDAGFKDSNYLEIKIPDYYSVDQNLFLAAVDNDGKNSELGGRMGESIQWTGWGAWN